MRSEALGRNRPATTGFTFVFVCREQELVHRQEKTCRHKDTNVLRGKPKMGKTMGVHKPREKQITIVERKYKYGTRRQRPRVLLRLTDGYRVTLSLSHSRLQRQLPRSNFSIMINYTLLKFALVAYKQKQLSGYLQV